LSLNKAAGEKKPEASSFYPPDPELVAQLFPEWGAVRIFRAENEADGKARLSAAGLGK
jgi:hypothetical protein